ncbi:MAG: BlaI/MecI/CopY family transcriptional regulator [Bacteroides sp.]|nr:BlaI/MecI/CopY family transcriptional regulator [Eubacterium sp.]MCM1418437.1 BlaI/MecI/CopY family transcriptional regulator [Roseburia sp.]MCM1461542.1 BlaI/MecI/CopY family transcriptional regulator [Bacteroides sp.]
MNEALSEAELLVMNAVWEKGAPATVAELVAYFAETKGWKVQTVATFAGRLVEKGYLTREKGKGANTYSATLSKTAYHSRLSRRLINSAYGGSVKNMVASLLDDEGITRGELDELKRWLDGLK